MNIKTGINVLSLFDGISVAQLALTELNIPIDNYYASEIDKRAIKVTQHHFEDTIHLGDIKLVDGHTLPPIDLLVCGSPCQSLSSLRKNRQGLNSEDSGLLFEAVRLLEEVSPKHFLFENVSSMSKSDMNRFNQLLGVVGSPINSHLISAQNRNRIYWTNIPNISSPIDKGILLQDIVESGYVDRVKSNCVLTKNVPFTRNGLVRYLTKSIGGVVFHFKEFADLPKKEKLRIVEGMDTDEVKSLFRLFTINELEKLQTLPVGYVEDILKKTPSAHVIGNGFTKDIIKHILTDVRFS